ncbi:MAG: hypothetical protein HQ559_11555 [Lentisphaerae bacterium]|nr:hypothetical protein [Lentisphaerota bacterium]
MITERERNVVAECARKYHASRVVLFGSSLARDDARDIDLGVEGVAPSVFFRLCGELIKRLDRPVDVIDLSMPSAFSQMVQEEGVAIYG